MGKFTKYTTPEDAAILNRLQPSPNFDRGAADSIDYRVMRSCVEAMRCSLPASRVQIETNQSAGPHEVSEYLLTCGRR